MLYIFSDYNKYIPSDEQLTEAIENLKDETKELSLFAKFIKTDKYINYCSFIYNKIKKNKDNKKIIKKNENSDEDDKDLNEDDGNNEEENFELENITNPITNVLTIYFIYSKDFFDKIMNNYFTIIEKEIYR